ncbi:DUF3299 domain-containing protein [Parvularcula sp. IMCC14364]|uniref:DUF3299 domain-containing protein n=1 Tax=Parvularcula sp. IMCC14364 TaxID=3067902 RepID=UPI00274295FD|nr:DUF3299 domain-containing protein [Parvularcula sp. IMCC14364]
MRVALFLILMIFAVSPSAMAKEPREIGWDDLLPAGEDAGPGNNVQHEQSIPLFGDMTGDLGGGEMGGFPPVQYGTFNTVEELDGEYVKIPGFALALEFASEGNVNEFLLVPYFGACVHVPPPPPNQIVYVTSEENVKLRGIWDPVWLIGTMRAERNYNDLGNAAYTLELERMEPYE